MPAGLKGGRKPTCGRAWTRNDSKTARPRDSRTRGRKAHCTSMRSREPLHLDHLASLRHSLANQTALVRHVSPAEPDPGSLGTGYLAQHGREWSAYLDSLEDRSFVRMWSDELSTRDVGDRLRLARDVAGMTQGNAAKRVGIARTTLLAIEKGQRRVRLEELSWERARRIG